MNATVGNRTKSCPNCNNAMKMNEGYITWCEACHYNINPSTLNEDKHRFERIYDKLGEKFGHQLFETILYQREKRFSFSMLFVYIFASMIHVVFLLFFLGCFFIPVVWGFSFGTAVLMGICLLFTWLLRPVVYRLEETEVVLSRHDLPTLFKIIDEICREAQIKPVDGVILSGNYNASITSIGWRQKRIMNIGLPLFHILTLDEKVSVLAHEIGHLKHGDTWRGWYIQTAQNSLATWYETLQPDTIEVSETLGAFEVISLFIMKGLSYIPYAGYYLFGYLLYQDSQRAEYEADQFEASISGSEVAVRVLEKIQLGDSISSTIYKAALSRKEIDMYQEIKVMVDQMPIQELKRIKVIGELEKTRLSLTHPPTHFRIRMLQSKKQYPSIKLDAATGKDLIGELSQYHSKAQEDLFEDILWRLS